VGASKSVKHSRPSVGIFMDFSSLFCIVQNQRNKVMRQINATKRGI
jgi:hypothetical protein